MPSLNHIRRQRGLTLIEALFWVGGFGILVAGIVAAAGGFFTGLDSGSITRSMTTIKSEVENNLYAGEPTYGNESMLAVLNDAGVLPDNWAINGDTAQIPGGLVARVDGNGQLYSVSIAPLDEGTCTQVVQSVDQQGWNGVNVELGDGTPADAGPAAGASNIGGATTDGLRVLNITPAQASAACAAGNATLTVSGGR